MAKEQFSKVLAALPCGASDMTCKLLTAGKNKAEISLSGSLLGGFRLQDAPGIPCD